MHANTKLVVPINANLSYIPNKRRNGLKFRLKGLPKHQTPIFNIRPKYKTLMWYDKQRNKDQA